MTHSMIQAERLTKSFGHHTVLNGLDLDIPKGSVVGLLGQNGSGSPR